VKTFALLGHPLGHSVSPALHHAAYEQFGLDHRYVTIDCPDEDAVKAQREALVRRELAGLNITVPWKRLALRLADRVDPSAARTGAANVWVRTEEGQVVAHNTDAGALRDCLRAARIPRDAENLETLVLGNGGAARAAVVACLEAGARIVRVSARKWRGVRAAWEHVADVVQLGATPVAWVDDAGAASNAPVATAALQSGLIVQATSAGMKGVGGGDQVAAVIPWSRLPSSVFVYDVVYNPERTPFLDAAREHGLRHEGGLSMLVGQAALAIHSWLGLEPSHERMREAATRAIFGASR
jgi:shikimate dehydrogenase